MKKDIALAELIVIAPEKMDEMMTFVNADAMSKSLAESGKVALYGIYFDTDKDTLGAQSQTTLAEIAKLMTADRQLKLRVVGHTDNQGKADYNLDLSRRRAASVVRELTSKYGVAADRLDSFGAGLYAPVASNDAEEGRAKNRRVEFRGAIADDFTAGVAAHSGGVLGPGKVGGQGDGGEEREKGEGKFRHDSLSGYA